MHFLAIQKILGLLLLLFSATMVPPLLLSLWFGDGAAGAFFAALLIILALGMALYLPAFKCQDETGSREGFLIVALFWVTLSLVGAVPLLLVEEPWMSVTEAVFESVSGLTTTGATVLHGLDHMAPSLLYYRQQLQWLGGMGIIVLAVAVLPMLGIGGMQLYRAEIAGPMKNNRLTARLAETAKALWAIYVVLTAVCAAGYWLAGMSLFDAVCHAFSTIAIGGFSTHDASIGYFQSPLIEGLAVFFMLVAGINFALHFTAWRTLTTKPYQQDAEMRAYLGVLGAVALVTTLYLFLTDTADGFLHAVRLGIFQTVSIGTTTGFSTAPHHEWPGALPILLLLTSFIGACAGSTGGGMKVIRSLLLWRQGQREVLKLIHPHASIAVKIGGQAVSPRVVEAIWGFFAVYVGCFVVLYLVLAATEQDLITAFSAVASSMNNLGPGLGDVGPNFATVSDAGKWVLCLAMLLGRLEVFTLLVLLTPAFWRN